MIFLPSLQDSHLYMVLFLFLMQSYSLFNRIADINSGFKYMYCIDESLNIPLANCCFIDLNSSWNSSGNDSELRLTD